MTIEQLEKRIADDTKELERLRSVKPVATPESVDTEYVNWIREGDDFSLSEWISNKLDWTPYEKPIWMRELVEGMPCLWRVCNIDPWKIAIWEDEMNEWRHDFLPFDESLVGKVAP